MKAVYKSRKERRGIINLVFIYATINWVEIGLSFVAGVIGAFLGGLINLWIHYSGLKNVRIENQKNRIAEEINNDKTINAKITLAVAAMKVNNISTEEVSDIFKESNEVANVIIKDLKKNLSKTKEEIEETGTNDNKELDNDIINTDEEYRYARQN